MPNDENNTNKVDAALSFYSERQIATMHELEMTKTDMLNTFSLRAMARGDKVEVDRLFDAGVDMSRKMPSAFLGGDDIAQAAGNPAFIHVMTGQKIEPEMISYVGSRLGDVNIENDFGKTALDMLEKKSAPSVQTDAWKSIGAQKGSGVLSQDNDALAASAVKLENEDPAMVAKRDILIANAGDVNNPLRAMGLRDDEVITMMYMQALADGDKNKVDELREAGGSLANDVPEKVFSPEEFEEMGRPKLAHLVAVGPDAVSAEMISHATQGLDDVDLRDSNGKTPLIIAAEVGSREHVDAWINAGADVNAKDKEGYKPFMHAAMLGHTELGMDLKKAARMGMATNAAIRTVQEKPMPSRSVSTSKRPNQDER